MIHFQYPQYEILNSFIGSESALISNGFEIGFNPFGKTLFIGTELQDSISQENKIPVPNDTFEFSYLIILKTQILF